MKGVLKMAKFKVGDKVRVNKNISDTPEKDMYTIKDVQGNRHLGMAYNIGTSFIVYESEIELVKFTKQNLKDGMVVKLRNGRKYFVCDNLLMGQSSFIDLNAFNNELEQLGSDEFDIVGVYKTKGHQFNNVFFDANLTLLWERREEPKYKEMTVEEIEKELGYKIKVIADKE
jgi:hypothetical protein